MGTANVDDLPMMRAPSIAERLRIGSMILAGIILVTGIVDVLVRPEGIAPVAWIYAAHFAIVVAVQVALRQPRPRAHAEWIAAAAVVAWNALFSAYAAHSPDEIDALSAPTLVIITAAALMLPWGLGMQAVVASACVLGYAVAFTASGHVPVLGSIYAFVSLAGAAAVSCAGAWIIAEHERIIDRQTERLTDQNRVMREAGVKKDEFLASVSHELRTPLNVVLGYIDLLLDHSFGTLEPSQRDILHRITKNASNLSHLINDLIDLSRIDAGRLKVEIGIVDVAPLFGDMHGVMQVLLAGHDVEFVADLAPGCGPVRADAERLKQIVSNLLVNAVKFTERGAITLRAEPRGTDAVAISVTDTGIGIPPTAHRMIFEPFRQVHDRSRRAGGAGIGLSISRRLAELMGGSLEVESEPGRGSRFTLVLAVADAATDVEPGFRRAS